MNELIAKTLFGLEKVLADELSGIGATDIKPGNRYVVFKGDQRMMYRANMHLRTALKILSPLQEFRMSDEKEIYQQVNKYPWEEMISWRDNIAIDTVLVTKRFSHSIYISQLVKDAIADRVRSRTGKRPSVDLKLPDYRINVHINDHTCSLALDSSGDSLHKRGYRIESYRAPLNEVLAAGMILIAGWNPNEPFLNPMCGSGTLAIEAALIAKRIPAGFYRNSFAFQKWHDYNPETFLEIKRERFGVKSLKPVICASDISADAIDASKRNFEHLGLENSIRLEKASFKDWKESATQGLVIINPPYGERILDKGLMDLYKGIGDRLKKDFTGMDAWILSGNPEALKQIGLQTGKRLVLFNGQIKCKYHKYSLYRGSIKARMNEED